MLPYSQDGSEVQNPELQGKHEQEDEGKFSLVEGTVLYQPVKSVVSNLIL